MKYLSLGLSVFSILTIRVYLASAGQCEDQLKSILQNDTNNKIIRFIDSYSCPSVNGCALTYENDHKPYLNSTVLGYLDLKNELKVNWAIVREGNAVGWELAGNYQCADVKTSFKATILDEKTIHLSVQKETAGDSLFCPVYKSFASYQTTCLKNLK